MVKHGRLQQEREITFIPPLEDFIRSLPCVLDCGGGSGQANFSNCKSKLSNSKMMLLKNTCHTHILIVAAAAAATVVEKP
jgi:hypothetical protein